MVASWNHITEIMRKSKKMASQKSNAVASLLRFHPPHMVTPFARARNAERVTLVLAPASHFIVSISASCMRNKKRQHKPFARASEPLSL